MVAASPSSSVLAAGPITSSSKCCTAGSASPTTSMRPTATSSFNRSASCRSRRRPCSSSVATTSTTATRFGNAVTMSRAPPVAFRLMTALASATMTAAGSVKQVSDPIALAPPHLQAIKYLAQLDAIEMQKTGELSLTQEVLPVCLSRQHVEAQCRGAVRICLLRIRCAEIAEDLPLLFVRDTAVVLKPVPRAGLDRSQFLKPADERFARYSEEMSKHDDMSPSHLIRPRGYFLKFLHHRARRRQQGTPERVGITFLARSLEGVLMQDFRLAAV